MDESVVTVKGQVVIPARFRRKFGIKKGTRVHFVERDGEIGLLPMTDAFFDAAIGLLKGKPNLLQLLAKEKKREREL